MNDANSNREWALMEFERMSDSERRLGLWYVEQLREYQRTPSDLNVFHWSWQAANDNEDRMHTTEVFGYAAFVRMNTNFCEILELWRTCKYDAVLTKLAFPL